MIKTLAHHYYHQPGVFTYECEQLFCHHWWLVANESAFVENGDYQALQLMQWPLIVVRDQQGELRAFYNLCRHRAGPLVDDPCGRRRDFVCRYHGWRYACSGELLKTPGFSDDQIEDRGGHGPVAGQGFLLEWPGVRLPRRRGP